MSSSDDTVSGTGNDGKRTSARSKAAGAKKREVARACDACRRRKVRCNAHPTSGERCGTCSAFKLECTFLEEARKRGQPKGYIEDLEKRVRDIELLLGKVAPDVNIESEIGPSFTKGTWNEIKGTKSKSATSKASRKGKDKQKQSSDSPSDVPAQAPAKSDNDVEMSSAQGRGPVSLPNSADHFRIAEEQERTDFFHGNSSGAYLVNTVMQLKRGTPAAPSPRGRTTLHLRTKYWRSNPWETIPFATPPLNKVEYPPDDLVDELVEQCFTKALSIFPILHRPSFDRDRAKGLHKTDVGFAAVFLHVCANGSRYVDDPRVLDTNADGERALDSAGWNYFRGAIEIHNPSLFTWSLPDMQSGALSCLYLMSSSAPPAPWVFSGIVLRCMQNMGAHREKVYGTDPTHAFQNQMWKRTFWSVVTMDRLLSSGLGRSLAVYDEDVDTELPLEVDDEYFIEGKREWRQPPDKPARMSAFINLVKLNAIHAHTIRTLYSINKSKAAFSGPNWESDTVAELDSALNAWSDNLPEHVKWDPSISDPIHLRQVAVLRLHYNHVQIMVHRKYLSVGELNQQHLSSLSFPSLAICTNAARSTLNVLEQCDRAGMQRSPMTHTHAFLAATVLLVSMWDVQRNRLHADVSRQLSDVHKCIQMMHQLEDRWHIAGRACDILIELASMNEPEASKLRSHSPSSTRKRAHDDGSEQEMDNRRPRFNPSSEMDLEMTPPIEGVPSNLHSPTMMAASSEGLDASLMSLFGANADLSAGLQWDPSISLFSFGQLPSFDPTWSNYLVGNTGNPTGAGFDLSVPNSHSDTSSPTLFQSPSSS